MNNLRTPGFRTKTGCEMINMVYKESVDGSKKYHIVYSVANTVNGMIYIGKHSTNNLNDGYLGSGNLIKRAIAKYGKSVFTKSIIEYYSSEAEMNAGERFWIGFFSKSIMYNLTLGGEGNLGHIHSPEIRQKIALKGERNGMFGKKHSLEAREKIRQKAIGRPANINGLIAYRKTDRMKQHNQLLAQKARRKINQYDLNGNLIKVWESGLELKRFYNTSTVFYWIKKGLIRNNSIYKYA